MGTTGLGTPPGLQFLDSVWVLVLGSILCVGFGVDFGLNFGTDLGIHFGVNLGGILESKGLKK